MDLEYTLHKLGIFSPWVIAVVSAILLKLYISFLEQKLTTLAEYNKIKQKEILDKEILIKQFKQIQERDFEDKIKASRTSRPDPSPMPSHEVSEDPEEIQPEDLADFKPLIYNIRTKAEEYDSSNIINYPENNRISLYDIYNSSDFQNLVEKTNKLLAQAEKQPSKENEAINLVNNNLDLFKRYLYFMTDPNTMQPVNYYINKNNRSILYASFQKDVPMWFVETFESVLDEHIKNQPRPKKTESGGNSAGAKTSPPNRPQEAREQGQAYQTPQTDENATQSQHREQEAQGGKSATSSAGEEVETDPRADENDEQEPPQASAEGIRHKEEATDTGERIKPNFGVPRTGTSSEKRGRGRPKKNANGLLPLSQDPVPVTGFFISAGCQGVPSWWSGSTGRRPSCPAHEKGPQELTGEKPRAGGWGVEVEKGKSEAEKIVKILSRVFLLNSEKIKKNNSKTLTP